NWGRMPEMLERIEAARREGLKITADVYPYVAGSTSLSACLPPWALEGGTDKMIARLRDAATRERLKKEISADSKDWENIYLGSGGPVGILINIRSEEHTSELQSPCNLVCRLLLEKIKGSDSS